MAPSGFAAPKQLMGMPPAQKRKKTGGEIAFDVTTYGGISLLGNEILGIGIIKQAENGVLAKWYKPFTQWSQKLPLLNKLSYVKEGRASFLLWATISGTLLVLPVKLFEDNKGKLVRFYDRHFNKHGNQQQLAAAHKEMEDAPPQTWSSLGEGRLITIGSALAVDSLIGWPGAPIAKLFDRGGKVNNYASFERATTTLSRNIVGMFSDAQKDINAKLPHIDDALIRFSTKKMNDTNAVKLMSLGGSLLVLSTALTALFYASSKAFARGKTAKDEAKQQQQAANMRVPESAIASISEEPSRSDTAAPTIPGNRIVQVENLDRVADNAKLQAGV